MELVLLELLLVQCLILLVLDLIVVVSLMFKVLILWLRSFGINYRLYKSLLLVKFWSKSEKIINVKLLILNIMKKKFNYQVVFEFPTGNAIVFTGQTDKPLIELLQTCTEVLNYSDVTDFNENIVNVVYQPVKQEKGDEKK